MLARLASRRVGGGLTVSRSRQRLTATTMDTTATRAWSALLTSRNAELLRDENTHNNNKRIPSSSTTTITTNFVGVGNVPPTVLSTAPATLLRLHFNAAQHRAFSTSSPPQPSNEKQNEAAASSSPPPASVKSPDSTSPSQRQQQQSGGRPPMPRKLGRVKVPTPSSALPDEAKPGGWLRNVEPRKLASQTLNLIRNLVITLATYAYKAPYWTYYYLRHPDELRKGWQSIKDMARHEAEHYWNGTKLLVADVRTARSLVGKTLDGNALTRRERKQLLRTVSDLFRLVPFSMFVLIPFMEFALPFALRLFPNMLPSTFQDSLKAEESMKRELKSRIAMAQFFQETMETLAQEQKKKAVRRRQELEEAGAEAMDGAELQIHKQEDSAASMLEFLTKARNGEMIPPDIIIRYANYFQDDLTLDNMPRMQLINMCRYMSIPPYGSDSFLRFQLRHRIRSLKEDDQRILWEGIESLTKMELREAVQERGMRSTGLSKDAYKRALQQWLDLSVNKNVPIALLIMSRTFFLQDEIPPPPSPTTAKESATPGTKDGRAPSPKADRRDASVDKSSSATTAATEKKTEPVKTDSGASSIPDDTTTKNSNSDASLTGLADAISGLDQEVLNEVILQLATKEEKTSDPEIRKLKLEVLEKQNELIRKEEQDREAKKQWQAAAEAAAVASAAESSAETGSHDTAKKTKTSSSTNSTSSTANAEATTSHVAEETAESADADNTTGTATADGTLSTEEMSALRTILTDDPVSSEREALERIKAALKDGAMQPDQREELKRIRDSIESHAHDRSESQSSAASGPAASAAASAPMTAEEVDSYVADQIKEQDERMASESSTASSGSSTFSTEESPETNPSTAEEDHGDEPEDPIVSRLKRRVESMVDKIELQLSETQVKIGDKMHLLDKDRDGILSREEVAEVLQQVFKKNISFEEAMEIADEMDDNHDGIFTVDELLRWIDEHRLVKFVEEGMDVDLDELVPSENASASKDSSESTTSSTSPTSKK